MVFFMVKTPFGRGRARSGEHRDQRMRGMLSIVIDAFGHGLASTDVRRSRCSIIPDTPDRRAGGLSGNYAVSAREDCRFPLRLGSRLMSAGAARQIPPPCTG